MAADMESHLHVFSAEVTGLHSIQRKKCNDLAKIVLKNPLSSEQRRWALWFHRHSLIQPALKVGGMVKIVFAGVSANM
jgi:hypothetical protein